MNKTNRLMAVIGALSVGLTAPAALAQSAEEFFKGKTVTVYIGFSPGGTYDLFGRMVSQVEVVLEGFAQDLLHLLTGQHS